MKNFLRGALLCLFSAICPLVLPAQTRTAVTYMGSYNTGTSYTVNDIVSSGTAPNLTYYISLAPNNSNQLLTNTAYWQLWSAPSTQGSTGATGATGPAGPAASVAIGSTTTGAAGSQAAVTNSGSSSSAILNFVIPQGAVGATGPAGANGVVNWRGPWSSTNTYAAGDAVSSTPAGGSLTSYVSSVSNNTSTPGASGTWLAYADGPGAALAALNNAALTGTPTAPTPTSGDASSRVATTQFVSAALGALNVSPTNSYTVGATASTQYTLAMQDSNGNAVPVSGLTTSNAGTYIGVFQGSAAAGANVQVMSAAGQLTLLQFENTPVIGDVVIPGTGTGTSNLGHDTGYQGYSIVSPRTPIVGTVEAVNGSLAMVRLAGLGVSGTGDFLIDNKVGNQTLPYGGLNVSTIASPSLNNLYSVAGYSAVNIIPGWTPNVATPATGTADGANKAFTFPALSLASAYAIYVNGTLTTAYTTTGYTVTFTTAPPAGATVTGLATAYDMARAFADLAVDTTYVGQTVLLAPGVNYTCKDSPLPIITGQYTSTSIIGWGSGTATLQKEGNCGVAQATLYHPAGTGGQSMGLYQGFTVNAAGIDTDACDFYANQQVVLTDLKCEAPGGSARVIGLGGPTAAGWSYNVYAYNLRAFASTQHAGRSNPFTLTWTNGQLTNAVFNDVTGLGAQSDDIYSTITTLEFYGPGLASCTVQPSVTPNFINAGVTGSQSETGLTFTYANLTAPTIVNPGQCTDTSHIWLAPFDSPVAVGIDAANMTDSVFYDTEVYSPYFTASLNVSNISSNNTFIGMHSWSSAFAELVDAGSGNKYSSFECDSPAAYCVILDGPNGFINGMSVNEDTPAYWGASGVYFRNKDAVAVATGWVINDFVCTNSSLALDNPYFVLYSNKAGALSATNPIDVGVSFTNAELCDGTKTVIKTIDSVSATTTDGVHFAYPTGLGFGFGMTAAYQGIFGTYPDWTNDMLWLRNRTGGTSNSSEDADAVGIDPLGWLSISEPIHGTLDSLQLASPGAPTITVVGATGTSSYTYACTALDANNVETTIGTSATISTGPATLSSTNYIGVTCPFVEGFKSFNIYRQANDPGLTQGNIGQLNKGTWEKVTGGFLKDTGLAAGVAPPTVNLTGGFRYKLASGTNFWQFQLTPTGQRIFTLPDLSGYLVASAAASFTSGDIITGSATGGEIQDSGVALSGLWVNGTAATVTTLTTTTNCSSSSAPASCGSAVSGSFVIKASATGANVNTTAVTANSIILITPDESLSTKLGVTCNTTAAQALATVGVTARTAGTSFTVATTGAVATNPACFDYLIIN